MPTAAARSALRKLLGSELPDIMAALEVLKFNPNHSPEDGKFTSGHGGRINTLHRGRPGTKENPGEETQQRRLGTAEAYGADPAFRAKTLTRMSTVAGFRDLGKGLGRASHAEEDRRVNETIDRMADNIMKVYNHTPAGDAAKWGEWYPIAHDLSARWGKEYGIHPDGASAVIARLSPSAEWFGNLAMARRVLQLTHDNPIITKEHIVALSAVRAAKTTTAASGIGRESIAIPDSVIGQHLNDVPSEQAGALIRAISTAHGVTHIENELGQPVDLNGDPNASPAKVRWQSDDNLGKAVDLARNPSHANIDSKLGSLHKIRSFYNNIVNPHDDVNDDVTADTHAIGIALGIPVTANTSEMKDSGSPFKGGKSVKAGVAVSGYPLVVEAYRRAAKKIGKPPRWLQSVTWEQWRHDWPETSRKGWAIDGVRNIWKDVDEGKISRDRGHELADQLRRQLPGVAALGSGTNTPGNVTGEVARYVGAVAKGEGEWGTFTFGGRG